MAPTTQRAVRIHKTGSLDIVQYDTDAPIPDISDSQILINTSYAGINFVDNYFVDGTYASQLPHTLGREGAGTVVKIGSKVSNFKVGDRVGYFHPDAFSEYSALESSARVARLPDGVSEELAAASILQGLTALTFVNEAYSVKKDDYVLIYAAAGGAGGLFVQLAHLRGAHVIGVVSTEEKAQIARGYGAEFIINYRKESIAQRVNEITSGKGVIAAFDAVGKDTYEATLQSISRKGFFISYGNASGQIPPLELLRLAEKNIIFSRPNLTNYVYTPEEWNHYSSELFRLLEDGKLKINISKVYPLSETQQAMKDLYSGKTTGKLLIKVQE